MSTLLTNNEIKRLKPNQWATESNARGAGQLQARGLKNKHIAYYFRYTDVLHKQTRIPLGSGLTLLEARRKAQTLSRQLQEGCMPVIPVRGSRRKTADHHTAQNTTFAALLQAYVEDLHRRNCTSASEVQNAFKRYIQQPWAELWNLPVNAITTDHILQMVRCVADQNKLRAADKLRCYIRAAYAAAIQARQHIDGLPAFIRLNINSNPARDIPPIRNNSHTKDRVLSLSELQTYWQHISQINTSVGALLRFHLLTGGQRIQQLARATTNDYDKDSQTLTLKDPKGRRHQPRLHTVPLLPQAKLAMEQMLLGNQSFDVQKNKTHHDTNTTYLWTVTQGQYGACYSTASKALKQVIEQIQRREAKKSAGGSFINSFTLGDIRRTIETRLAAAGVSRETRAQLQSHGLSGVQVRHYDRHDYLHEKKEALETLYRLLTGTGSEPVDITTPATNTVSAQQIQAEAMITPATASLLTVDKEAPFAAPVLQQTKQPTQNAYALLRKPDHQTSGVYAPTHKVPVAQRNKHRLKPTVLSASAQLAPQQPLQQPLQQYTLPHRAGP